MQLVFETAHHDFTWLRSLVDLAWAELHRIVNAVECHGILIVHQGGLRVVMVLHTTGKLVSLIVL